MWQKTKALFGVLLIVVQYTTVAISSSHAAFNGVAFKMPI